MTLDKTKWKWVFNLHSEHQMTVQLYDELERRGWKVDDPVHPKTGEVNEAMKRDRLIGIYAPRGLKNG